MGEAKRRRSFLSDALRDAAADDRHEGRILLPWWLVAVLVVAAGLAIWLSPARAAWLTGG
ncbi:MAG TPA: hypothetical protein VGV17_24000 [Bosea sp. (in: a-proteobacteria)]|jgi:hypothetical protein|uniref:hypothetical protein n=1 Tax=Bosea sp. (in: a-proteobacteria) TaxID=1871050 RepID=UPI002DDD30FB|nr:hypothetical protein [Bosea sp. (in: a-proteobacteria)]HEV2556826.1 hypothetical protein [Bosea sp. (in: a-proteobacteria)]